MNKNTIIASAIIAAGLSLSGYFVKSGIDNFSNRDREVTVRGLAERIVEADFVTWPINYSIAGNELPDLYNRMQANNIIIVKFLKDNGITEDEISVNPPSMYDAVSNRYYGDRAQYKYTLSNSITVSTTQVEKVRELLSRQSELFKQGVAVDNGYVRYQFTGLNDIKPEMIAEATRNARVAADQFANDSQSRVGKIKTASQGTFSISDSDDTTPQRKLVRVVSTIVYALED